VIGLYVPGDSLLHRAPAGLKLVVLAAAVTVIVLLDDPWQLALAAAAVAALYLVAGIPPATALAQVRPLLWFAVVLLAVHTVLNGWMRAAVVVGSLVVAVAAAALVTLTTRTTALLDTVERALRPARRLGVDPARVALMLALAIRAVPVVADLAGEVRDAQRARGAGVDLRTFAVPLVVRTLRRADAMGEALAARGLDD
jgi:biotin transport system permease protein